MADNYIHNPFWDPDQPAADKLKFGDFLLWRRENQMSQRLLVRSVKHGVIHCSNEHDQYHPIRIRDYERGGSDIKENFQVWYAYGESGGTGGPGYRRVPS